MTRMEECDAAEGTRGEVERIRGKAEALALGVF